MENVTAKVKQQIMNLTKCREDEMDGLRKNLSDSQRELKEAQDRAEEATRRTDLKEFQTAQEEIKQASTAVDMYNRRIQQLNGQEIVTEADSDAVIDSLLKYEKDLDAEFREAIREPIAILRKMQEEYQRAILDTEDTIRTWSRSIRANFRTFGRTTRIDKTTGEQTDRSERPVPVHMVPYDGVRVSKEIREFLEDYDRYERS